MISNIMTLNINGKNELYLLVTGGRYLPTGCDSQDRTTYNDFEVQKCLSPRFMVMDSGSEAI